MKSIFKNRSLLFVSYIYFIVMLLTLFKFGMDIGGEAPKYISGANSIINSTPFEYDIFSYFYFSYSLIVAFFIKFSLSYFWIGIFQICLSYFSALLLYKLVLSESKNEFISISAFSLFLLSYPIQKWLLFVYSEGVHTSLVVIGIYVFFKVLRNNQQKNMFFFLISILLILTSRPVGVIFIMTALCSYIYYLIKVENNKRAYLIMFMGFAFFIAVLNSPFRYFVNPDSLRRMEIICQVPENGKVSEYSEYNKTGLYGAFKVIKDEIGVSVFLKNGFLKLKSFFFLVRPYYSLKNNLFLSLNLIVYPFALLGLFFYEQKNFNMLKFFCGCYILITTCGIFITCDNWSNRFIAPVFPFIIILAAFGMHYSYPLIKKYLEKFNIH